jgi:hypothetical protein
MPGHATSDLEIAQRACVLVGTNRIEDFSETSSTEALVMSLLYEDVVRDCLTATRWNFATKKKVLTSRNADAPLTGFDAAYTYLGGDDGILQVNTVEVNGSVVDYDINENEIHLDCNATDEVVLTYTKRVEATYWPPFFTLYVILRLCAVIATSIVRNEGMAAGFERQAAMQLARARSQDSQQVTSRGIRLTRIMARRRVGGGG